jgi:type 1 fimbriae regulatory protein FimE
VVCPPTAQYCAVRLSLPLPLSRRHDLIGFRHGLRASEICDLEWSQVEFGRSASLHVRRVKNGKPSVHPLRGEEIRALRELRRQFPDSGFVFATERGGPFTPDAVNRLIKRIGERAGFDFPLHGLRVEQRDVP